MRLKAGRAGERRTPEEQRIVQAQVAGDLLERLAHANVVLEFILYEVPPRPLLAYQGALAAAGVRFETRVLRPSLETVMRRMRMRGRPGDRDVRARRLDVAHQLDCLAPPHISDDWVLDTSGLTLEETYAQGFREMVEGGPQ